jgi:carbonic anhydrase
MGKASNQTHNLRSIVERVRPSVETVLSLSRSQDPDAVIRDAVRANVRASSNHLRHGSALLEWMIENDGLIVVGAEYSLETGKVDFFDGVPDLS